MTHAPLSLTRITQKVNKDNNNGLFAFVWLFLCFSLWSRSTACTVSNKSNDCLIKNATSRETLYSHRNLMGHELKHSAIYTYCLRVVSVYLQEYQKYLYLLISIESSFTFLRSIRRFFLNICKSMKNFLVFIELTYGMSIKVFSFRF